MNLLALELSSPRGSAALLRDSIVLGAESWAETRTGGRAVFEAVERLLARAGLRVSDIEAVAAGRGPGQYSGMRIALTAAETLMLPGGGTAMAVSSGAALAMALMAETGADLAAVVGDARRGRLWVGVYRRGGRVPVEPVLDWRLCRPEELEAVVPAGALLVSSESARVRALAPPAGRSNWVPDDRFPDAAVLGRLALARLAAGLASEPLTPIYMHPAV